MDDAKPDNARISDILPLITDSFISEIICFEASFLSVVAPTPTGSNITGIPTSLAFFPALSIASTDSACKVPMFISSADENETTSSTSRLSSAIIGDAPEARIIFAQSLIVTVFVKHSINGFLALVLFIASITSLYIFSLFNFI